MSTNQKKDAEQLKVFNSPIYRRRIKRMVEMAKTVRGIHGKIPNGDLPKLKETASQKEKDLRAQQQAYRLNIGVLHYFAATMVSHRPTDIGPSEQSDA